MFFFTNNSFELRNKHFLNMIYLKTKKYHSIFYFKLSYVSIEKYLSKKILSSKSLKIFDLLLGSIKNLQLTLNYNLIIKRTIIKNAYSPSRKLVTEKYQRSILFLSQIVNFNAKHGRERASITEQRSIRSIINFTRNMSNNYDDYPIE